MVKDSISIGKPLAIILAIAITIMIMIPLVGIPFGSPEETQTDDYYIDHTQAETGASNAVTAVVFDYRGFDTLGEATVLFVAVLSVIMLFRRLH